MAQGRGVLALNASYEPLAMLPLKTALRLIVQEKAEVVESDAGKRVRSEKREVPRPVVIRLFKYVKVPARMRKGVTNTILFARDGYRCQYCARHQEELVGRESLTRDHIVPQCRGGKNTWENCVTACSRCNHRKGDKSLAESGLRLLSQPAAPDMVWLKWSVRKLTPLQEKYITAFYGADVVRAMR